MKIYFLTFYIFTIAFNEMIYKLSDIMLASFAFFKLAAAILFIQDSTHIIHREKKRVSARRSRFAFV